MGRRGGGGVVTTVQNLLLHHRHNRPIFHLMAGAGKLPESTFFNRDCLRNKTIFIFYIFFCVGGGKGEGFLVYKEVTTENTVKFRN